MIEIIVTRCAMGQPPIPRVQPDGLLLLVNDRVDAKRGRDERCNALTLFMHCIAIERACLHTRPASARFEIQSEHVRRFDRLR